MLNQYFHGSSHILYGHIRILNPILGGYTTDNFWLNQILGGSMTVLMVKFILL